MICTAIMEWSGRFAVAQFNVSQPQEALGTWLRSPGSREMLPEHLRLAFLAGEDLLMPPTPLRGLKRVWHTVVAEGDHPLLEAVLVTTEVDPPIGQADGGTFTYCTLVDGGTYTSQYWVPTAADADRKWLSSPRRWRTKHGAKLSGPVPRTREPHPGMFEEVAGTCGLARFDFLSSGPPGTVFRIATAA